MIRTRAVAIVVMTAALIAAIGCGSSAKPDSSSATITPQGVGQADAAKHKRHKRPANWPTYHANLARTGVDTTSPALGSFHRTWTKRFDGQVYAEPLAVGSRVYVA